MILTLDRSVELIKKCLATSSPEAHVPSVNAGGEKMQNHHVLPGRVFSMMDGSCLFHRRDPTNRALMTD